LAKINKTKYAILGMLNIMPGSGYDIKKLCDSSINYFWHENYGHIYPMLKKMEEGGLVTKKVEQTRGNSSRNVYSITDKGRTELENWLMLPVEDSPNRSEFLLKIFLSGNIPLNNILEKIEAMKENCENDLKQYSKIKDAFKAGELKSNKKNLALWESTVTFGKYIEEAKIKWCEETLEAFKNL
jgi:DNA-binding PadR family transcriptional regulator